MEYNYSVFRGRNGTFYRPTLDVVLQYKDRSIHIEEALVDTGADCITVPLSLAESLGVEPDFESETIVDCACGRAVSCYSSHHAIEVSLSNRRSSKWLTHVQFINANTTVLLGHRGFLDRFNVSFHGKRHVMNMRSIS